MSGLSGVLQGQAISPRTVPPSSSDQQVIRLWETKTLSDGTRLNLGHTDHEQGFVVRNDGTYPVDLSRPGIQRCEDGTERIASSINLSAIVPNSGSHTHPLGRTGDLSGLPGPEDGAMAARTGRTAYVVSSRGAFAIDKNTDGFAIRQLAGHRLSFVEQGEVRRLADSWNRHDGGSGIRCTFTPTQ